MNNELQEHHIMAFDDTCPDGKVEWYCPTCGRRIRFERSPIRKMVVLSQGDQYAIHSGSTGGLSIVSVQPEQNTPLSNEEKITLRPWLEWMEKIDFEELWDK